MRRLLMIGMALVLALYLIGRQWDAFTHTFSHFFSWEPKSRSKPSRYSSETYVLIENYVKYTDFFLLSLVYV